jgi:hypothetical protein
MKNVERALDDRALRQRWYVFVNVYVRGCVGLSMVICDRWGRDGKSRDKVSRGTINLARLERHKMNREIAAWAVTYELDYIYFQVS